MSQHTPGPWVVSDDGIVPVNPSYPHQHIVRLDGVMGGADTMADARLMAVSPGLLEVAEALLKYGSISPPHWIWEKAEKLVEQAKGEA